MVWSGFIQGHWQCHLSIGCMHTTSYSETMRIICRKSPIQTVWPNPSLFGVSVWDDFDKIFDIKKSLGYRAVLLVWFWCVTGGYTNRYTDRHGHTMTAYTALASIASHGKNEKKNKKMERIHNKPSPVLNSTEPLQTSACLPVCWCPYTVTSYLLPGRNHSGISYSFTSANQSFSGFITRLKCTAILHELLKTKALNRTVFRSELSVGRSFHRPKPNPTQRGPTPIQR